MLHLNDGNNYRNITIIETPHRHQQIPMQQRHHHHKTTNDNDNNTVTITMRASLKQFRLIVQVGKYDSSLENFIVTCYRFIRLSVVRINFSALRVFVLTGVHCITSII